MMVSFECCNTQLEVMEASASSSSSSSALINPRRDGSSRKKGGLRRLMMRACWSEAPIEIVLLQGSSLGDDHHTITTSTNTMIHPSIDSLPEDVLLECLARVPRDSLHHMMLVCHKWKHCVHEPGYYERRRLVGTLEPLLFVFGGSASSSIYYSKHDGKWLSLSLSLSLPSPLEVSHVNTGNYVQSHDQYTSGIDGNVNNLDYQHHNHHHHHHRHRCYGSQSLHHAQPAVVNHCVFIIGAIPSQQNNTATTCNPKNTLPMGGHGHLHCTIMYDSWSKTLTRRAPMRLPRKKFACCSIGGRIYVAGGANRRDPGRDALMDAEQYIPEEDKWEPIANMPRKRYGCLGVAVDDIFYVVGGLKSSSVVGMCMQPYTYISSMDLFDPRTNTWQKTKPLPTGGCVIACTVVGSCIYMLSSHAVELSFWEYDTHRDRWTRIKPPPIPSPLRLDNRLKFSCTSIGTSVYVIQVGGCIDDLLRRSGRHTRGLKEGLVLIYDTISEEWSRGPDLPSCIKNGAACAVVHC